MRFLLICNKKKYVFIEYRKKRTYDASHLCTVELITLLIIELFKVLSC